MKGEETTVKKESEVQQINRELEALEVSVAELEQNVRETHSLLLATIPVAETADESGGGAWLAVVRNRLQNIKGRIRALNEEHAYPVVEAVRH